MADRDVNLVIKAKEQATKAIDSVADALRVLSDVQKDVGQSASKADGLLGSLKNELAALDKEARGLAALNTVAAQMDKAATAVGKLDAAAKASYAEYDKLSAATARAATNTRLHAAAADAAKAAYDKQKAAVANLTAAQRKDEAATAAARAERDKLKMASQEAAAALKTAESAEKKLQAQLSATSAAAERQGVALAEANSELSEIAVMANKASAALGGVEATQEAVAAASARAAADMDRLNKAMAQQTPAKGAGEKTPVASTKASLQAWRDAEAEVKRLAVAMKSTEAPSREMQTSMLVAQAAARSAKTAYTEQRTELARLTAARRVDTTATQQATVTQAQNTAVVRGVAQAQTHAATQTYRLRDAFSGIYGESRQAMNMFQRMRAEVLSLASAYVGLYAALSGIGTVIDTMRALEQAQNRLSLAFGGDQSAVGAEMRWLEQEASRLKMSFADLAAEYGKFAFSAKAAGFATEEMRTVFLGVAEGARVMGLSMDEVQGILKALDQIMSKGKVQAEELRGQLGDRLSGSFQLFAQAIGVSTQELDKMMEQGEVFATRSNMVAFGQKLRDTFGPQLAGALETTTAEINDFQANLQNAARQVGEGGLWDGLGKALRDLNEWFKSDEGEKFFTDIGVALGKLVQIIPFVAENFGAFFTLFKMFAAFKAAQVILSLASGMGGLSLNIAKARADVIALTLSMQIMAGTSTGVVRTGLMSVSGALVTMRGALIAGAAAARTLWIAIGGLPGLILTGLTLVISTLAGKWLTSVDRATEAIQRQKDVADALADTYSKAGESAEDWRKSLDGVTQSKIIVGLEETREALEDLRRNGFDTFNATVKTAMSRSERETAMALRSIVIAFKNGEMGAEEYARQLDAVIAKNPDFVKTNLEMVSGLLESASKAKEAEKSHKWYEAVLKELQGTATDVDKSIVGLTEKVDGLNESMDTSAVDAYTAAMKRLGDAVPNIKAQLDFDEAKLEIEDAYMKALNDAGTGTTESFEKMAEATRVYQAALAALGNQGSDTGSYRDWVYGIESFGGDNNATNPRNPRVLGAAQFDEATWLTLFKRVAPNDTRSRAAQLELRRDPEWTNRLFDILTDENARALRGGGFVDSDVNKYLAHLLGSGRALSVLRAGRDDPSKTLGEILPANVISDNAPLLRADMTPAQLQANLQAKRDGQSGAEVAAQQQVVDLLAEARKKQDEFNNSIVAGVSQREFEIAQLGRTEKEQLVQVELRKAQLDAQKDSLTLSAEQETSIRRSVEAQYDAMTAEKGRQAILQANSELLRAQGVAETRAEAVANGLKERGLDLTTQEGRELAHVLGLTWDVVNAEKARNKTREQLDNNVSNLDAQRQLLMEQIEFSQSQGDTAAAEALKLKLDELNLAYLTALQAKRAFWVGQQSAGGEGAAQAAVEIANVDRAILQMEALKTKAITTGKEINQSIASGVAGAFDKFAQAVAEGENAWRAFGDAFRQFAADFLRQIANMIIQALILKLLTGDATGGGGGMGGWIAGMVNGGVRHNGGMVGSGGGNRSVWAGYFANATRYHSGGIVGMKPNEVPIIAEKGEEVLDAGDPRHRDNLGGGSPMSFKAVNLFDAADMLEHALADERGQRVFLNYVRNNPRAFNSAVSV